ncbi:MAG: alpha/beta hydrolase, partial [bacterium]
MPHKTTLGLFLVSTAAFAAGSHQAIPIWPASALAPGAASEKEIVTESSNHERHVTNVNNPTITVYLPPKNKATGAAVVICPGGGHRFLSVDQEGYRVAEWFNSIGVAAFVLKYRLAKAEGSHYTVENSVEDAQQSIRLIRSRAGAWGIDTSRVGILGFSAGGEIAARVETRPDREGKRPDFAVIVYPGMNQGVLDQVT